MSLLFQLPLELVSKCLSYLTPNELTYSFDLGCLPHDTSVDPYDTIKLTAVYIKYTKRHVIISDDDLFAPRKVHNISINNDTLQLSISQLEYIVKKQIIIKPKEISFIIFDCRLSFSFIKNILDYYLVWLRLFTSKFNFQLIINDNGLIDRQFMEGLFVPFKSCQCNINWFSITYNCKEEGRTENRTFYHNTCCLNHCTIKTLKLNIFNSNKLMDHYLYLSDQKCNLCCNLKILDLSYNNIDDNNLSLLKFPDLLQHVNLSNNCIYELSHHNLNIGNLINLKEMNLSNNNLIGIYVNSDLASNLETLDLSGNCLNCCQFLCNPFFEGLIHLNLSRNLISSLESFPRLLEFLNLSSNYLASFFREHYRLVFPISLVELNLSWCKIPLDMEINNENTIERIIVNNLPNLQLLNLCGNRYYDEI